MCLVPVWLRLVQSCSPSAEVSSAVPIDLSLTLFYQALGTVVSIGRSDERNSNMIIFESIASITCIKFLKLVFYLFSQT
jgi:hypothetical protein